MKIPRSVSQTCLAENLAMHAVCCHFSYCSPYSLSYLIGRCSFRSFCKVHSTILRFLSFIEVGCPCNPSQLIIVL